MSSGILLLLYTLFAATVFLVRELSVHAALSAGIVFALLFIPFRKVRGGIVPILFFLGFTFLSNVFYRTGEVLLHIGPVRVTDEGLRLALLRTVRVFEMVYAAKVLAAVVPLDAMLASLKRILAPLERIGVPVHDFFTVTALTLKCFPVLAQRLREEYRKGGEKGDAGGPGERIRRGVSFLVPLFAESMRDPEGFFSRQENRMQ
ncbi:MAG: energy-coupling factor transporter transmembrane protein EcfT [Alphaproteobacteria bacterium]|uniref:Energy-coupling factor transporter transmembrane protein EcfT n=1 Tax=Candidatus Nitrobium versatile TaxID=2884831 RepID=A0A953M2I8_9BACT|nr:energy-coupling factor transporter transmembrane protein EcfT [Candidatus Nitrobium versatile]